MCRSGRVAGAKPGMESVPTTKFQGFLLRDDGHQFRVVLRDWTVTAIDKSRDGAGDGGILSVTAWLPLAEEVRRLLPILGRKDEADKWFSDSYDDRLSQTGELFSMARLCALSGSIGIWPMRLSPSSKWCGESCQTAGPRSRWRRSCRRTSRLFSSGTRCAPLGRRAFPAPICSRGFKIETLCPKADYELSACAFLCRGAGSTIESRSCRILSIPRSWPRFRRPASDGAGIPPARRDGEA